MKKVIQQEGFWKSVAGLAGLFIVIYNVVDVFLKFDSSFSAYAAYRFDPDNIVRFIFTNLAGGFVYGFIVTYFKFKQNVKKQEK